MYSKMPNASPRMAKRVKRLPSSLSFMIVSIRLNNLGDYFLVKLGQVVYLDADNLICPNYKQGRIVVKVWKRVFEPLPILL